MKVLLKKPSTILIALIAFKASQLIYALLHPEHATAMPAHRAIELGILSVVVLCALKRRRWALWLAAIYLFLQIGTFAVGLFIVPLEQFILKGLAVALGAYFVFGGWVLARVARADPVIRAGPLGRGGRG